MPVPAAPSERVVFSNSFEALIRTFGGAVPPAAIEAFLKNGIDLSRPLQAAYPWDKFVAMVDWCSAHHFPNAAEDRFRLLGRRWFDGYGGTLMGKAVLSGLRLFGPRRVLERATRNFRSASNYVETELEPLEPGHHRFTIRPVRFPGLYQGILEAGLELAGARELAFQQLSFDGSEVRFEIRWRE